MRVLSKEYQEHLKNNEIYQFIMNQPRPNFSELEKLEDNYEDEMFKEFKKSESEKCVEMHKKVIKKIKRQLMKKS